MEVDDETKPDGSSADARVGTFTYWAFISYSRKDESLAKKLHRAIETYPIPRALRGRIGRDGPIPAKLFPIFRDREELPLSSDIGSSIEDALRASRYLIVLCSPNSAKSDWVNEEVRRFKAMGREDRILAIMLDGTPNAVRRGQNPSEECFCPALAHDVAPDGTILDTKAEPIAGDFRENGERWSVILMRCLAGITGLGYDSFARRDAARRRRTRLLLAACGILTAAAGIGLWDHLRLKTSHHANLVEHWGGPVGWVEIPKEIASQRADSYRIESTRGKIRRIIHQNGHGTPIPDPDWFNAAVQELQYDESGELHVIEYRNRAGHILLQRQFRPRLADASPPTQDIAFSSGREHTSIALSSSDSSERQTRPYDPLEPSVRAEITTHRVTYLPDGRTGSIHYLDPFGQPAADADGIFGKRFSYQNDPIPDTIVNLSANGAPAPNRHGITSILQTANRWGDLEVIRRVDAMGSPVLLADGYASLKRTHDAVGNLSKLEFFDAEGKPSLHADRISSATYQRDRNGNLLTWSYFDIGGKPVRNRVNVSIERTRYTPRGEPIESRYYDESGKPIMHTDGMAAILQQWDETGNNTHFEYLGLNGERILNINRYCYTTTRYDALGHVSERAFFGINGEPVMHTDGISRIVETRDKEGRLAEIRYFGTANEPVVNRGLYHQSKSRFDRRGNEIEIRFFDTDGQPVLHRDGISIIRRNFDPQGRLTDYAVFGTDGKPCNDTFRIHRHHAVYEDASHNPTQRNRYDKDGRLIP
jgi:hypothetical protein